VVLAFYRGRGSTREGWPGVAGGVNAGVNGFNAIEDRGLDEGLRSEIMEGNQGVE
jgi:hypothetical protein